MKFASIQISLQVVFLLSALCIANFAWSKEAQGANQQVQQPLAGLDKMLKQANGVKVDAIVDNKLATNVTNALNDMAQNLRKMFVENRKLNMQVQDLLGRVQNATGVNATNTPGSIQSANMSILTSGLNGLNNGQPMNLGSLMQRFGQ